MANDFVDRPAMLADVHKLADRLDVRIGQNELSIKENTESIIRLGVLYKTLEDLPRTFVNLDKTLNSVQSSLESINTKVIDLRQEVRNQSDTINELKNTRHKIVNDIENIKSNDARQNEEISRVDNKSKIDWQSSISNNFWKIISLAAMVLAAYYVWLK